MTRCFPGTVLFEGTTLSEGRGTTNSLEIVGGPDVDFSRVLRQARAFAPQWLRGCQLRGAFTGADRAKPGLFEVAHGGTIFLDEIGEVSQATQVQLLRVLDSSTFRHFGGTSEIRVDVRVLAATNRELPAMVKQGLFREDLFYRLSTITIEVPPLRRRAADVARLAEHFVAGRNERYGSSQRLSPRALEVLQRHDWPGNVRELLHAIEAATVVCDGEEIRPEHLPRALTAQAASPITPGTAGASLPTLEQMQREHIAPWTSCWPVESLESTMKWIDLYRSKLTTPDKALEAVQSGHRVLIHQGCNEPEELVGALVRRGPELRDVEVIHMATMGSSDYTRPEFEGHIHHNTFFIGANVRQAVQEGRAGYVPIFLHEIEGLFTSGAVPIDVALLQCSKPDDYGYLSLGTSIDVTLTGAKCARHVIVEVNDQCPRTLGDTFLHVSRADAIVECSHPLAEMKPHEITDTHRAIARYIAALIPDGATLQRGIGGIPDAAIIWTGPGALTDQPPRLSSKRDTPRGTSSPRAPKNMPCATNATTGRASSPTRAFPTTSVTSLSPGRPASPATAPTEAS